VASKGAEEMVMALMRDIPDLLEGLRRSPKILSELIETIPENRLDLRRGSGFWTIAEHAVHLAQVQPMLLDRMNRFVAEDHPEFVPYMPSEEQDAPDVPVRMGMSEALEQFLQYRHKQIVLLEHVNENIWQRKGKHPEYDHYSLYILVRHTLMHDHWHMYRIEELWLTKDAYLTRLE
jgi:uncharacterized damage-inducible protein DinB